MVFDHRAFALIVPRRSKRFVHHVVVVQRREVGQFNDDRGRQHAGRRRVAELCGEQDQQRPEALATRNDEVPRRFGDERVSRS